jgi:uncharacterized Ntn-hydrolase superfamily protein
MISKTSFVNAVKALMSANETGGVVPSRQAAFLTVLAEATDCQKGTDGKTWVDWWVYDNKFGKNQLTIQFNHAPEQIETPEELYDLIVFTKGKR